MKRVAVLSTAIVISALSSDAAQAQQVRACVNNSSGEVKLVGQNATCKNNETLVALGSGGAGIRSGAQAFCTADPSGVPPSAPLQFERYAEFGSDISANGLLTNSFVLQPGIYQVHLSADNMVWGGSPTLPVAPGNSGMVQLFVNGVALSSASPLSTPQGNRAGPGIWLTNQANDGIRTQLTTIFATWTLGGDHVLSVISPNTTIQFIADSQMNFPNSCRLIITRLSDGPARFPGP